MSSPTARAADNKREEFRRYLERSGVIEELTRALHTLYEEPEKPEDPVRYICGLLSRNSEDRPTIDALQAELEEMRLENQRLRDELENFRPSPVGTNADTSLDDTAPKTISDDADANSAVSPTSFPADNSNAQDDTH